MEVSVVAERWIVGLAVLRFLLLLPYEDSESKTLLLVLLREGTPVHYQYSNLFTHYPWFPFHLKLFSASQSHVFLPQNVTSRMS